jgi:hypothetical protein
MTATTHAPVVGVVCLLHFDQPYRHARHYVGWTIYLPTRMTDHASERGARLLAVITEAGIEWQLARTWIGTRGRERQLKRQGGAARHCPVCGITPRGSQFAHLIDSGNAAPCQPTGLHERIVA